MPTIQNVGQNALQGIGQQTHEPGALGKVGNLRFKAEPGATPRAGSPNIFQRIGQGLAKLAFYVTASPERRAQQFVLDQARDNSRRIGNLLGNLTAPPDDPKARQALGAGLAKLANISGGDLSALPGGAKALSSHLQALGVLDLNALQGGVLSDPKAREEVLRSIDPPHVRAQAGAVLDQIALALDQQIATVAVQQPLSDISAVLRGKPVDGQKLQDALTRLSANINMVGGGRDMMGLYLQTLSDEDLGALSKALGKKGLQDGEQALRGLPGIKDEQAEEGARMLNEVVRGAVDKAVQARLEPAHTYLAGRLDAAVESGDKSRIARQLFDLRQFVSDARSQYGGVPPEIEKTLRESISAAVDALRDPSNPDGPLTRDTFSKLDDVSFGLLRRARGELGEYGLTLSREDAKAEAMARVQGLTDRVTEGMTGLLRTLSEETPDVRTLTRQLRELSELELTRSQQLGELGEFGDMASVDDRLAYGKQPMRDAIARLRDQGEGEVAQRAFENLGMLLTMREEFRGMGFGMSDQVGPETSMSFAGELLKRVGTSQHMLNSLIDVMDVSFPGDPGRDIEPQPLPEGFRQAVLGQFGVDYDTDTGEVALSVSEDSLEKLVPHLEEPINPRVHASKTTTLPLNGVDTSFQVSEQFIADGIERGSISLSVRGPGPDGAPLRTNWPDGVPHDQRGPHMGVALDALQKVAGPAAEPLTRIMNQQLGAGILKGLMDMGGDSPFKLPDGSVVMPSGGGSFHFDLQKLPDGSFQLNATMRLSLEGAARLDENGVAMPVALDPGGWAEVRVTLLVSPDGQDVRVGGPPQFRSDLRTISE